MVMNKSARCGCATGLGVLAALAAAGARSSAAVPELEIITVVGKTPQPLSEVAATVSVITAEDLVICKLLAGRDGVSGFNKNLRNL